VPAGEAVAPGISLGQTALKSGHSSWLSRLPSAGITWARAQNRAPKKAAKNITSEKMNQLMLQRKEASMRWVLPALALADGIAEPLEQHAEQHQEAGQHRIAAPADGR
jgi:hypothetical protein